jgi:hypothetical protein
MRIAKIPVIILGTLAAAAVITSAVGWLPFWSMLGIFIAVILVNGLIATVEDDLPGGFNNPNGDATPRYLVLARLFLWTFAGLVAVCLALGFAVSAVA